MRHVNFLEKRTIDWRKIELNYFWILLVLAVLVLGSGVFGLLQHRSLRQKNEKLVALTAEVAAMKAANSKLLGSSLSKQQQAALLNNPIAWSNVLKNIAPAVPSTVFLVQITGSLKEKRLLILKGRANHTRGIFQLKSRLASLQECDSSAVSSFENTRSFDVKDGDVLFQLECKLR